MRLTNYIAGTIVFILLFMAIGLYWQEDWKPLADSPEDNRITQHFQDEQRFQWAVFLESQDSLESIYLFSYEPITGRFFGIHVPPSAKITSELTVGIRSLKELYGEFDEKAPENMTIELEETLSVDIPYWFRLSETDLASLLNLAGGTRVPLSKPALGDESDTVERRWMDGKLAIHYLENAYSQHGNQGLRHRHKTLLLGTLQRFRNHPTLLNNVNFQRDVDNLIDTNLYPSEWLKLLDIVLKTKFEDIRFLAVNQRSGLNTQNILEGRRLRIMLPQPLKENIEESEPQNRIRVQLLNGAGITELAAAAREQLQPYDDIDVVEVGNADRYDYETTQIIDRSNNPQSAYRIQELLGTGEIEIKPVERLMVDVTLILGRDARFLITGEGL